MAWLRCFSGYGTSGSETAFARPYESLRYQGYYAQDTWQVSQKLTLTYGVRWEIPGVWRERYNRIASFNPTEVNPATKGVNVNGQPVLGALDFVLSPQHPDQGSRKEWFNLFAPRAGIAYRLNDKTVIRAGGGIYYLPSNLQFSEAPWGMPLSSFGTPYLGTLDGGVTLNNPISNPFPNGFFLLRAICPMIRHRHYWSVVGLRIFHCGTSVIHTKGSGTLRCSANSGEE